MRRRDFLYAGGALACGAGVAKTAGGWGLIQPQVKMDVASAFPHRASTQFVADGLGPGDDRSYYARLISETPDKPLFTEAAVNDSYHGSLRNFGQTTDFSSSFVLLVETRMEFQARFGIMPLSSPQWVGWRIISIPVNKYDWGNVEPDLVGADELIITSIINYSSAVVPDSGRTLLYDRAGDSVQRRLSI